MERDLAALGEHVCSLDGKATQLSEQYPDQAEAIKAKQSQINQAWNDLVKKVSTESKCSFSTNWTILSLSKIVLIVFVFLIQYSIMW